MNRSFIILDETLFIPDSESVADKPIIDWNVKIWWYKVYNEVIFYLLLVLEKDAHVKTFKYAYQKSYLVSDDVHILR